LAKQAVPTRGDTQSFDRLRDRLMAIAKPVAPLLEPRPVALRGLVVADCLTQPDRLHKLQLVAEAGVCDLRCIEDLREVAKAVLFVLTKVGQPSVEHSAQTPEAIRDEAKFHRHQMADVVEHRLNDFDEARLWLEVLRLGKDDVDLMFDLRVLASLFNEHEALLAEGCDCAADAARARALARDLETSLMAGPGDGEYGDWLTRAWTLLAVTYEETCRIARFVLHGVRGTSFPSLVALARSQRRQKTRETTSRTWRRSQRPFPVPPELAHRGEPPVPRPEVAAPVVQAPAKIADPEPFPATHIAESSRPSPGSGDIDVQVDEDFAEPAQVQPEPNRSEPRFSVELQVNISSDSNLYVGFTENLSNAGIFVATHVLRPIGSSVEVNVRFPGRQQPVRCRGEVRWIREHSANRDAWPGMGIRFDQVDDDDKATLSEFLQTREPIFFVE
jgi:type IV pilus assembly protein PilZ